MKGIINNVDIQLSLEEVQMLAAEINEVNWDKKEGTEGHKIMLRKLGEVLTPIIEKHKIVNVITNYRLTPNS